MDIAKSFTFLTEDERWLEKLGTGTLIALLSIVLSPILIGILGFAILSGYSVRLLQNVRDGSPRPLPEWDRWSQDMSVGIKLFVVMLLYALPIIVLMIPNLMGAALSNRGDAASIVGVPLLICGVLFNILYGLFFAAAQPGITIAFARDLEIRSGLDWRLVWAWTRSNLGSVLLVVLVYIAASAVIGIVAAIAGTIMLVVGLAVTIPLSTLVTLLVQHHLYGQLAWQHPLGGEERALIQSPAPQPVIPPMDDPGASI